MRKLRFGQDSGKLWDITDSIPILIGMCYSGNGAGLNNSAMDGVSNVGVIRRGGYSGVLMTAQQTEDRKRQGKPYLGSRVFILNPDAANDMAGRFGFLIHWDTPEQNFTASDGCLVPLNTASVMSRIDDAFELEVVSGF